MIESGGRGFRAGRINPIQRVLNRELLNHSWSLSLACVGTFVLVDESLSDLSMVSGWHNFRRIIS
uniref:Uncharacterized protein n=1 Tax=Utricularia reniformis TaxID=192314 RepID=A0A1Y0B2B9_9LAMI|nr:hypothetical protein AEK19_MT1340 [Utricularia reniformis]ART31538.1 hypothetical protein AEK19_MT1340 [Utricularia reniformis]